MANNQISIEVVGMDKVEEAFERLCDLLHKERRDVLFEIEHARDTAIADIRRERER